MPSIIDSLPDFREISHDVKAWDTTLTLVEQSADIINRWIMTHADRDKVDKASAYYELIAMHIQEGSDRPLQSDKGRHHIAKLAREHPDQFAELLEACCQLSGIGSVTNRQQVKKKRSTRNGRLSTAAS